MATKKANYKVTYNTAVDAAIVEVVLEEVTPKEVGRVLTTLRMRTRMMWEEPPVDEEEKE